MSVTILAPDVGRHGCQRCGSIEIETDILRTVRVRPEIVHIHPRLTGGVDDLDTREIVGETTAHRRSIDFQAGVVLDQGWEDSFLSDFEEAIIQRPPVEFEAEFPEIIEVSNGVEQLRLGSGDDLVREFLDCLLDSEAPQAGLVATGTAEATSNG